MPATITQFHDFAGMVVGWTPSTWRAARSPHVATRSVVPSWHGGPFGADMSGDVLLPDADARIAPTTFAYWLSSQQGATSEAT